MTITFKIYNKSVCFNSFYLFLRTKYQHKSLCYDQIMNRTMLQYQQIERKFKNFP